MGCKLKAQREKLGSWKARRLGGSKAWMHVRSMLKAHSKELLLRVRRIEFHEFLPESDRAKRS
jgi:hypothetical protein